LKKGINILLAALIISNFGTVNVLAANGQGSVSSRTDTVNVNDYSTDNWDRFEYNYQFESGSETNEDFGIPTQTDAAARNTELENIRRNKDASYLPPSYGVFSGEIPTEQSSPYHSNVKPDYAANVTYSSSSTGSYAGSLTSSSGYMSDTGVLASTSTMQEAASTQSGVSEITISQSTNSNYLLTETNLYSDGSLGTLKIPALGLTVTVYEGETLENLKKGVGHFEFSSAWDGNVCIAGHNSGSSGYFEDLKDLVIGDKIIYETKYGKRTYKVTSKKIISDTDYSTLGWSSENQITLITCNKGVADERLSVTATET